MSDDSIPTSKSLVQHSLNSEIIHQRASDGYINATAFCRAAGKLWADYARLKTTKAFVDALSADMGIPITELIQSLSGGEPQLQGTWVHPQVAIHLAQWASPEFAVKVSRWVVDWMSGKGAPLNNLPVEKTPYAWMREVVDNMEKTDQRLFSVEKTVERLEQAVENLGGNETQKTIKAYAISQKVKITPQQSQLLGARAKNLSKQRGYIVGSQPDPHFDKVNTYHVDILEVVFRQFNEGG